jgi:5'-3' exonuclease
MSVLLVDGDNLLTIGFFGVKNYFYKGKHIGGIYHFLNTLRKSFETYHLDKICVFWDGADSAATRKKIYHLYKDTRRSNRWTDEAQSSYDYQRVRIKQYLEELYVRQGEYENCESDDCIAYYSQNSPKEKKIIYSSDRDLAQLVSVDTDLYNPAHGKIYKPGDNIEYDHETILIENVKIVKMLCGDPSDNIFGIRNLGLKRMIGLFPEMQTKILTLNEVRTKAEEIWQGDKHNKTLQNLLTGVSKLGVLGEEFFETNEKIVDLTEPILTDNAKTQILDLINETLDSEGRSYKNTMKMMMDDGMFTVLPKQEDAWIKFLNPFLRLTRKEKNKKIIKFKI